MKPFVKLLALIFQLLMMLMLPFWMMIRGSVFLYTQFQLNPWLSMLLMSGVVFLILLIYIAMIWDWLFGARNINRKTIRVKMWLIGIMLLIYTGFTLFYLSGKNAKTESVKKEYQSLHPYLRLAVGTWVLIDRDVLITDGSRLPEDYRKMGLKAQGNSLHYKQRTGYTHAMDLRTKGSNEISNCMLKAYFWSMGFNSLRHTGTADHLHISLSVHDRPGAI